MTFTVKRGSDRDYQEEQQIITIADLLALAGPRNCDLIVTSANDPPEILICNRHTE
jgi:hypothetical protein